MYNSFFNFREEPFSLTPDPRFFYVSATHQEALEHMLFGVQQRKGFVLLAGHIGAGKTTLTRLLIDRLEDKSHIALIFNTFLNEVELLRAINREFGLPAHWASRETLIQILNEFLIEQIKADHNVVLILDEAQNLSVPVLEQIRMLSNLETDNQKLIQIVLVGQPELVQTLARPDLAQLGQRVTVRCYLGPLDLEDTTRYIHHRLSIAGSQGLARFHPKTYRLIHKYTDGVPRRINALCDRALMVAYAQSVYEVKPEFVHQAQKELIGDFTKWGKRSTWWQLGTSRLTPALLIMLGLLLVVLWAYLRFEDH